MAQQVDDDLHIDTDAVFAARLMVVRGRASELLATVRGLSSADVPLRATSANESALRDLEGSVANAMHFAGQLKRAVK